MSMVTAHHAHLAEAPRRPASVPAIDARLSAWGQAARDAVDRRVEALGSAAVAYVERVGRSATELRPDVVDAGEALLDRDQDALVALLSTILPTAVAQSSRLLWVDPERLRERISAALEEAVEGTRAEVRRRQALYRRRARLWADDQPRLDRLREEVEALKVPRCGTALVDKLARGLLERHREVVRASGAPELGPESRLQVRTGSLTRWISQLDERIAQAGVTG